MQYGILRAKKSRIRMHANPISYAVAVSAVNCSYAMAYIVHSLFSAVGRVSGHYCVAWNAMMITLDSGFHKHKYCGGKRSRIFSGNAPGSKMEWTAAVIPGYVVL